ncbi:MAG TPA: hypothetical protein VMT35_16000 [Ignavibacteriaceae bacterium]|nr:hypothetical protein [Ignavibacteriaceae bacterium]
MNKLINKILNVFVLLMVLNIYSCAPSSNFYSGRTLEENKLAITAGADDIILKSNENSLTISKDSPFAPSVGAAYGLPLRLEAGLRWYMPRVLEVSLREQVNPRDFEIFDGSFNFTFGHVFEGYSYLRYGISLSKNINEFEPSLHYSFYSFVGATESDFADSFISGATKEFINKNRVIGFGLGIPVRGIKFFPEVDYQYYNNNFSSGLWHFGIGVRIYTN